MKMKQGIMKCEISAADMAEIMLNLSDFLTV